MLSGTDSGGKQGRVAAGRRAFSYTELVKQRIQRLAVDHGACTEKIFVGVEYQKNIAAREVGQRRGTLILQRKGEELTLADLKTSPHEFDASHFLFDILPQNDGQGGGKTGAFLKTSQMQDGAACKFQKSDEGRDGVSGEEKDGFSGQQTETHWLAGTHVDAPGLKLPVRFKDLMREVRLTGGGAAAGENEIAFIRRPKKSFLDDVRTIRKDAEVDHFGIQRLCKCGERRTVGVVKMVVRTGIAGLDQFVTGRDDGDADSSKDRKSGNAEIGE